MSDWLVTLLAAGHLAGFGTTRAIVEDFETVLMFLVQR